MLVPTLQVPKVFQICRGSYLNNKILADSKREEIGVSNNFLWNNNHLNTQPLAIIFQPKVNADYPSFQ